PLRIPWLLHHDEADAVASTGCGVRCALKVRRSAWASFMKSSEAGVSVTPPASSMKSLSVSETRNDQGDSFCGDKLRTRDPFGPSQRISVRPKSVPHSTREFHQPSSSRDRSSSEISRSSFNPLSTALLNPPPNRKWPAISNSE